MSKKMVCRILNRKTKILRHFENLQNYGSLYGKTLVRDRRGRYVSLQILFLKKKKKKKKKNIHENVSFRGYKPENVHFSSFKCSFHF